MTERFAPEGAEILRIMMPKDRQPSAFAAGQNCKAISLCWMGDVATGRVIHSNGMVSFIPLQHSHEFMMDPHGVWPDIQAQNLEEMANAAREQAFRDSDPPRS